MMADQEISIQINTRAKEAVSGLDRITASLEKIEAAFAPITKSLDAIASIGKSTSASISRLSRAIEKIDSGKFKDVANSLDSASQAAGKASRAISSAMKGIGESSGKASAEVDRMAKELARSFNINSKDGIEAVSKAMRELGEASGEFVRSGARNLPKEETDALYDSVQKNIDALGQAIREYGRFESVVDETGRSIRDFVSAQKGISLKGISSEFVDDFSRMRAVLGSGFSKNGTVGFDSFIKELNETFGTKFDEAVPANAFEELVRYLEGAREKMLSFEEASQKGIASMDSIKEATSHYAVEVLKLNQQLSRADKGKAVLGGSAEETEKEISAIQKLVEELNRYKAIVRNVEKASPEADYEGYDDAVRKVKELTESLNRYKKIALSAKKEVKIESIEIPKVQNPFKEMATEADKAGDAMEKVDQEIKSISDSLGEMPDMSRKASEILGRTFDRKPAEDISKIIQDAFEDIPDFSEIIGNEMFSDAFQKNAVWMQQSLEKLRQLDTAYQEHEETIRKVEEEYSDLASKASVGIRGSQLRAEIREVAEEVENYKEQLASLRDSGDDISSAWKKAQEKINNVSHVLEQLKPISEDVREKLSQAFILDSDDYTRSYKSVAYDYEKTLEYLQQLEDKRRELENMPDIPLIDFETLEKETARVNAYLDGLEERMRKMERLNLDIVQPKQKGISAEQTFDRKPAGEFLATIIALQHELEKMSQIMSRFGDIAAAAFKKAYAPLKLAKLEFDAIKTGVQRVGSAFAMVSKPITKIFGTIGTGLKARLAPAEGIFTKMAASASKAFSKISKEWAKMLRSFAYMGVRKIFTQIYNTFGDATKSLAGFSKSIGTEFNRSMSVLTSDFRYIGASIVAAFSPILNYVMPILDNLADAIVGVLNKANQFLAALTGAKSFTIAKKKIVDYTDALNDASKAAKSFTLGIDELNVLNEDAASSINAGDLFDWQEISTDEIPDSIKALADAVRQAAKDLFAPIKQAWDNAGDYVKDSFKFMADELKKLFKDIWRDFIDVWNQPETVAMLTEILEILGDIMRIVGTLAKRFREAWNENEIGKKILEDIRDILAVIVHHIHEMTQETLAWAESLDFYPLLESIHYLLGRVKYSVDGILTVVNDLYRDVVLPFLKWLIESGLPQVNYILADIAEAVGNLAFNFDHAWNELDRGKKIGQNIIGVFDVILAKAKDISEAIRDWSVDIDFGPLLDSVNAMLESIRSALDSIGNVLVDTIKTLVLPLFDKILEDTLPRIGVFISDIVYGIGNIAKRIDEAWKKLDFGTAIFKDLSNIIDALLVHIENVGRAFREWGSQLNFEPVMKAFDRLMQSLEKAADFIGGVFEDIMKDAVMPLVKYMLETAVPNLMDAISKFANAVHWESLRKKLDEIWKAVEHAAEAFNDGLIWAIDNLGQKVAKFVNSEAFQQFLDNIADFLNRITPDMVKNVFEGLGTAIIRIADAVVRFVNSELFQAFLDKLLDFMSQSPEKIASVLEKIALAIVGFKFIAFIGEGLAGFLSFIGAIKSAHDMASQVKILEEIASNVKGIGANAAEAGEKTSLFTQILEKISPMLGTIVTAVGGVISIVSGVVLAVSGLWDLLKNGFSWLGEAKLAIGLGLVALGATIFGAPAAVAAAVAGVIFAVTNLVVLLREHWDDITATIHNVWNGIKEFLGGLWEGIVNLGKSLFGGLRDFFGTIWEKISGTWQSIWEGITSVVRGLWENIVNVAHSIWDGITAFFSGIWEGIQGVWESAWNAIGGALESIWGVISGVAHSIWDAVVSFFSAIWDAIAGKWESDWNSISSLVEGIWNGIKSIAETVWGAIKDFFSGLWEGVKGLVKGVADSFAEAVDAAVTFAKDFVQKGADAASDFVGAIWDGLVGFADRIWEAGKMIVEGLWKGIQNMFGWLQEKVENSFLGKLVNTIKDALKIHSPSQVMADEVGKYIPQGIEKGIENEFPSLTRTARQELEDLTDMMQDTMDKTVSTITKLTSGITGELRNMIGILQEFMNDFVKLGTASVKTFADGFASLLKNMYAGSVSVGEGIAEGIGKGINNKWSWLSGEVNRLANSMLESARNALGIHSPSKRFADEIGRYIPEGIGLGIERTMPGLIRTVSKELDGMAGLVSIPKIDVPMYATGGFVPEDGLFYANHNEVIGSFSNGRTAVANNDMITEGIRDAVASAMVPYLSQIAQNTRETADKDLTVSLGDRDIARSGNRGRAQLGRSLVTIG